MQYVNDHDEPDAFAAIRAREFATLIGSFLALKDRHISEQYKVAGIPDTCTVALAGCVTSLVLGFREATMNWHLHH